MCHEALKSVPTEFIFMSRAVKVWEGNFFLSAEWCFEDFDCFPQLPSDSMAFTGNPGEPVTSVRHGGDCMIVNEKYSLRQTERGWMLNSLEKSDA